MTNTWLSDRLKLIANHFINLAKQEAIRTSIKMAVLRKHYAFQAEMFGDSNPFKKEVFQLKPIPDISFDVEVETEELADSEDVVNLSDYQAKSSGKSVDQILKSGNMIFGIFHFRRFRFHFQFVERFTEF